VPDSLTQNVLTYRRLLENGRTVEAIERFYSPDVCVFENRQLARAGRDQCAEYERKQLAAQPEPPRFRFGKTAVDEKDGVAFLEYSIRFASPEGRPMRIDQVAVQHWEHGLIAHERFYYEGVVDEGDESDESD
jgi:ketosteroid isomerase-like protein